MAIRVICDSCGGRFNAPDHAAGRKTKCPKCGAALIVSSASNPGTPKRLENLPTEQLNEIPKLIGCDACGHKIAPSAPTCPQCGAVNRWIHPEIQRFLNSLDRFGHMPPFNVNYDRDILKGFAEVKRGGHALGDWGSKAVAIGLLCMVLGAFLPGELAVVALVFGPLGFFGGLVLMLISGLASTNPTDYAVSFAVDFSKTPPSWQSDDESFWKDVKSFFLQH